MKNLKYYLLSLGMVLPTAAFPAPPGKADSACAEYAAAVAADRSGGKVLAADARRVDGRWMCRIKVLTPRGRVRSIYIDPGATR